MTPAINAVKQARISHTIYKYDHDPAADSYGLEASEKLELNPARVFKTLVVSIDAGELVVAVLPVPAMLSMKLLAHAVGGKKAAMADKDKVQRSSGYVLGGISPLGQKRPLRTVIDSSARQFETLFISAGRRGLEIELAPGDLAHLTKGQFADLQQR